MDLNPLIVDFEELFPASDFEDKSTVSGLEHVGQESCPDAVETSIKQALQNTCTQEVT